MMDKMGSRATNEGFALARVIETMADFADQYCLSNGQTRDEVIDALMQAQAASLRWGMEIAIDQGADFSELIDSHDRHD